MKKRLILGLFVGLGFVLPAYGMEDVVLDGIEDLLEESDIDLSAHSEKSSEDSQGDIDWLLENFSADDAELSEDWQEGSKELQESRERYDRLFVLRGRLIRFLDKMVALLEPVCFEAFLNEKQSGDSASFNVLSSMLTRIKSACFYWIIFGSGMVYDRLAGCAESKVNKLSEDDLNGYFRLITRYAIDLTSIYWNALAGLGFPKKDSLLDTIADEQVYWREVAQKNGFEVDLES